MDGLRGQGVSDPAVLAAIATTPRDLFTPDLFQERAFEDQALPIACGQTISQPYIVGLMTQALRIEKRSRVLEIGTGSGYQTAVLAALVDEVFSVERIRGLQDKARGRLRELGIHNVSLRHADGFQGWADKGPFDGILTTAAPLAIPQDLCAQLAPGGRLVIPAGPEQSQQLYVVTRLEQGFDTRAIEPVRFVPLLPGTLR
jgi:protein-L-isoaspartate(D-aspartate) O-methyltransferase